MNRRARTDPQAPKVERREARLRLRRAREAAGKTPEDFGEIVGSSFNYYDLENCYRCGAMNWEQMHSEPLQSGAGGSPSQA